MILLHVDDELSSQMRPRSLVGAAVGAHGKGGEATNTFTSANNIDRIYFCFFIRNASKTLLLA
eukprot:scaffold630_cov174-Amphora_coffeaeformis.AAC.26